MNKEIAALINQIARVRNVDTAYVCETLRQSVIVGLKRRFGPETRADVEIDIDGGSLKVFLLKTVVAEVTNEATEIAQSEAERLRPGVKRGEEVRIEIAPADIGRIAIRKTSEQLTFRLREAERTKLYDEYVKKRGEIVSGTIQKIGRDEIIVNLGLVEGILPLPEQLKTDHYRQGAPINALVSRVERTQFGPRILLSRTHPDFLRRLLIKEIPEIRQGIVEIRGIARAPSFRSKVAVHSADERVDPVGACVGYRKSRIDGVVKELSGEKIDIVQWSKDPQVFITRALAPAKVSQVIPEGDAYVVVVPDADLSIAIGRKGQNVQLAGVLVGAKIEVLKESDFKNRAFMTRATRVPIAELALDEEVTTKLLDAQVLTAFDLLSIPARDLSEATGIPAESIEELKQEARERLRLSETETTETSPTSDSLGVVGEVEPGAGPLAMQQAQVEGKGGAVAIPGTTPPMPGSSAEGKRSETEHTSSDETTSGDTQPGASEGIPTEVESSA